MSPLTENKIGDKVEPNCMTPDAWIADAFDTCKLFQGAGHVGGDLVDGLACPKYKVRCLGPAYIQSGFFPAIHATFYEVLRWDTSVHDYNDDSKANQPSCGSSPGHEASNGHDGMAPFPGIAGVPLYSFEKLPNASPSLLAHDETGCNDLSTCGDVDSLALPPKKSEHQRLVQRCIIFTPQNLGVSSPSDMPLLSSDCTYYLFPHDSLVKAVNDEAPFQIFCTFYLPKSSPPLPLSHTRLQPPPPSKIKSVTACGHRDSDRLFTIGHHDALQKQPMDRAINVEISGAPAGIYSSLKQTTRPYQERCKRVTDLLSLHNHHSTTCKADLALHSERSLGPPPSLQQSQLHDRGPECYTNTEMKEGDDLDRQILGTNDCDPSTHVHRQYNKKSDGTADEKDCLQPLTYRYKQVQRNAAHGRKGPHASAAIRQCAYCRTRSTPMWRRGPEGAGTLCNACGVKWKHGKILSGSEGFDPVHSISAFATSNTDQDDNNDHAIAAGKRKPATTYVKKAKRTKINEMRKQGITGNYGQDTASYQNHAVALSSSSSSDSTFNSPLASFTSSPHSSPPMSVDAQQYRGLLTLAFAEKFELDSDALPLDTGADDVEAAAVLTLLRQS